jgi:hypothetical protein
MIQIVEAVVRRSVKAAVLGVLAGLVVGCGLHLHRPSDEKQSRAATDSFKGLKLDAPIVTARTNADALMAAELETRQQVGEMLVRRDLLSVLAFTPAPATDQELPRGWPKLTKETNDVLARYRIVAGTPPAFTATGVEELRLITRRVENADNLVLELRVYDSLVMTYIRRDTAKVLSTECPPAQGVPAERPPALDPDAWNFYLGNIMPGCARVQKARQALVRLEEVLRRDPAYRAIADEITRLETSEEANQTTARAAAERYEKAKKQLADAENALAKATAAKDQEAKEIDDAKRAVKQAVTGLDAALDGAKGLPLLETIIKSDLLAEIVANAKFLSGDSSTAAHQTTNEFVTALKRYPDIAARFRAARDPGVNVFLLELALQRLEHKKLATEQAARQDLLVILRAKRETHIEAVTAWARVKELLERTEKDFPKAIRDRLASETAAALLVSDSPVVRPIVVNYAAAKLLEDAELPALDTRLADRYYRMSLDYSEASLQARNDLIRAPLQEITAYHEGGIRTDELAALLQALGLGAVGVGVNR